MKTNEEARPYPDHISGTFMDKSKFPPHILERMKKNQEQAKADRPATTPPQSTEVMKKL